MNIPPLVRRSRSISTELAAHLENLISGGKLQPGEKLPPERELAASMGVSRASLRQAMFELESKNLIERRQGSGSVVMGQQQVVSDLYERFGPLNAELENALELRDLVEPRIAELAALRAADSNLLSLEDVLLRSNENLSAPESILLDVQFHTLLAHAAQNPLLVTLCTMTGGWTEDLRRLSHEHAQGRRVSLEGHRKIFEAVAARDGAGAARAMEEHLREVSTLALRENQDLQHSTSRREGAAGDGAS